MCSVGIDNLINLGLGIGTDYVPDGEIVINEIITAIKAGYRHIDNADCYYNQTGVGIAINRCIAQGIIKREELFITSKVPDWKQGYDSTIKCCKESLKAMGLDYFDLYLIHSPNRTCENWQKGVLDTQRALETLYKSGLVKAIGVSNFALRHLEFILKEAEIKPMVNQIEFHAQHQQKQVVDFCKNHNIQVIGWGTLNQRRMFESDIFNNIAQKYNKDVAQIAIKYSLQKGVIPLARSIKKERIISNFNVNDFTISDSDMILLDKLDGKGFSNLACDEFIKPIRMVPGDSREYTPLKYKRTYKVFNFIPFLIEKKYRWNKTKWFLFGCIPLLKITKRDL